MSFFGEITSRHINFGLPFQKKTTLSGIKFNQIIHTRLKLCIVVTILGYIFQSVRKQGPLDISDKTDQTKQVPLDILEKICSHLAEIYQFI